MSHFNNIINAPVLHDKLSGDPQAVFSLSTEELSTLILYADINPWAKYKPVRSGVIDTVTGQWDYTNNTWLATAHWWKGDGMCGFTTEWATEFGNSLTTQGTFMYNLTHGLLGWTYQRPTGGSQQLFRVQDFAKYYHDAIQPYGDIGSTTIYLSNTGGGQIDWEVVSVGSLNLALADFGVNGHPLTDFYLGLILYDNSRWFLFTSSTKFTTGASLSVTFSNMTSYAGTWNCMPFFTLNQVNSQGTFDANGLFISMANTQPISIELIAHGNNYFDYIDGEWNAAGSAVSYELQIENETSTAHTYTQITIAIYKDSPSSNPIAQTTLTNITVSANSSRTLTGSISVSKAAGSIYWISVADNTSGSTIPGINNQVEEYYG